MRAIEDKHSTASTLLVTLIGALCFLGLVAAVPAQAGFERVGYFAGSLDPPAVPEKFPEEMQLGGTGGMAVNYTGAGGVTAGTVFAATRGQASGTVRIAMYKPVLNGKSETELKFSLGWAVTPEEEAYERCGPDLTPTPTVCPSRGEAEPGAVDVDIDQNTGNVYVLNVTNAPGRKVLIEYTPDGSAVITRFGIMAPAGKKTSETPDQIHNSPIQNAIAVNGAGEVFVYDVNASDNQYHRLMKFRPKTPGIFNEYEYAGSAQDVGAGFQGQGRVPWEPVADAAGNLYVAPVASAIESYDPTNPGAPPVCRFDFPKGGITAITVDPVTGTPFFFSFRIPKRIYQLGPCNQATGKFEGKPGEEVIDEFEVKPERDDLWGVAFDPVRKFSPTRSAGVLYAAAPQSEPFSGIGVGQPGRGSLGYIFALAEENPPAVEEESVSKVTERTAQLRAVIDPNGFKSHYVFQYMTEADYEAASNSFSGAAEAPAGGAFLKGTGASENVGYTVAGLLPDTVYRYRVVATSNCAAKKEPSKVCEDAGPAQRVRTYPTEVPGLHDDRAYELVSPAEKHGGQVLPADPSISSCGPEADCKPGATFLHFPMQSAIEGGAVVYQGTSFSPGGGANLGNQYISRRDPSAGWETVNLSPNLLSGASFYGAFDVELTRTLLTQAAPSLNPEAPSEYENLYSEQVSSPFGFQPALTAAPPNRPATGSGQFELRYAGASADLSHIFFAANDVLTEEVPAIAPAPEEGGPTKFNLYEWEPSSGQLRLVNIFPGNLTTKAGASFFPAPSAHVISADGSKVFWSDEAGQVYVREDAKSTRAIPDPGKFLSAAVDGSKVLLANGHLYDLATETTVDLTGGTGGAGFKGIVGQSDDLSKVYFVDTEVLSPGEENSEGAEAQAGKFNLYAWDSGTTRYVATLVAGDNGGSSGTNVARSNDWLSLPYLRTAEASPNGRFLSFLSEAPLTGYENTGPCGSNHAGGIVEAPCPEVFYYDLTSGELSCASCNSTEASPLGWSVLRLIKSSQPLPQQPRYLTDSGRLYFDSQDSLSQFDTNDGVEDVYEYQAQGVGSCKRESGCVTLISAGRSSVDSNFIASDLTGANVFFTSRDRLVAVDKDDLIDLYDAREHGGFPAKSESHPVEAPLQAPPLEPTPASPTVTGHGNVKPVKPCKKGQVRRKGKCVKKHKSKGGKKSKRTSAKHGGAK